MFSSDSVYFLAIWKRKMENFLNIMMVGFGGFIGCVLRYLVSGWINHIFKMNSFPIGTVIVNITGCLIIGVLGGWAGHLQAFSPHTRLFVFLGLLGGFTTFSAFGYETMALLRDQELFFAFVNVGMHLSFGFGAVLLGFKCSKLLGG